MLRKITPCYHAPHPRNRIKSISDLIKFNHNSKKYSPPKILFKLGKSDFFTLYSPIKKQIIIIKNLYYFDIMNEIKKQIGKEKKSDPLKKLKMINDGLKNLGCNSFNDSPILPYRKAVGHKQHI